MQIFISPITCFLPGKLRGIYACRCLQNIKADLLAEEIIPPHAHSREYLLASGRINGDVASKYIISCFLFVQHRRLSRATNISVPQNYRLRNIRWESQSFSLAIRSSASSSYVALLANNSTIYFYEVCRMAKDVINSQPVWSIQLLDGKYQVKLYP